MHIGFVTITFPPDNGWGGIGTYVYHLSQALVSLGHEVSVLSVTEKEPYEKHYDNLHIFRYLELNGKTIFQVQNQIAELIPRIVADFKIDVFEFPENASLGIIFQKNNPKFPTIVKLHGDAQLCQLGNCTRIERSLKSIYYYLKPNIYFEMEKETAAIAHAVVSPSQWQIDQCMKRGWKLPRNCSVIGNPFDGWPNSQNLWLDKNYTIPKALFLGRLDYRKGASLIPDVIDAVWHEIPEASFELIGQSMPKEKKDDWAEWILKNVPQNRHEQIILHGGISYLDLPKFLKSHSVAFFASTWESFGYTHIECMYAGIACVIASNGGAREIAIDGISCINTSRHPKAIAKALTQLLKDFNLRKSIGLEAHKRVTYEYSSKKIASQMVKVYEDVIRGAEAS